MPWCVNILAMNLLFVCLVSFLVAVQGTILNVTTLKFIYVVARHGTRAPTVTFPLDKYPPNNTKYWPEGPGQLTSIGKTQAYNIGVNIRRRYDDFLNPFYLETETRLTSNLYSRDLMSAQLFAAGLYPPIGEQIWNPSLLWQPVPIWPDTFDVADVTSGGVCPKFDSLQAKAYEIAYYDHFLPNKYFMDYIEDVTGRKFTNLPGIKYIYDTLELQEEHGFDPPVWATKDFRAKLTDISQTQYKVHVTGLPEMIRLTAGPVLKEIVNEVDNRSTRKIVLLMSHDNTIYTVARSLGFTDFEMPPMASYLIFEVHSGPVNSSDIVQILYFRNSSVTTPERLDMPVCRHPCTVNEFIGVAKRFIPDDWEKECELRSSSVKVVTPFVPTLVLFIYCALMTSL